MYIPKHYKVEDRDKAIQFMSKYSFGTIVNLVDGRPHAAHLPFVTEKRNDDIVISGHFAKANQQWKKIETQKSLIIFTEPHAYVSPDFYTKKQNVPTWNYVAVHAYGNASIVSEQDKVFTLLEKMMDQLEPKYKQQWKELNMDYKVRMTNGIVAFEMIVEELEFKKKLSQNKTMDEQHRIVEAFKKSPDSNIKEIGNYMEENLTSDK